MPPPKRVDDVVDVVLVLRDDDGVGAAGDPGVHGDPTLRPSHDLNDDDTVVRFSGGRESVDRFDCDTDRGIESKRNVGPANVIVDGLRHADHRQSLFGKLERRSQRPVAADDDETVDAVGLDGSVTG